jgi:hypothetical protein
VVSSVSVFGYFCPVLAEGNPWFGLIRASKLLLLLNDMLYIGWGPSSHVRERSSVG